MTWELAKGQLRALAALQGSYSPEYDPSRARPGVRSADSQLRHDRWTDLKLRVEEFIKGVEDDGLHE